MNNGQLIEEIYRIMLPITVYKMDGKPVPVKNTTRAECYEAIWKIQRLLFDNIIRSMVKVAKGLDLSKIFDDDIQHVGYTDEQLGREK